MKDTQNEDIDPLAQTVMDGLRKAGGRASLGFPSSEERERFKAEKAERDLMALQKRAAFKEQRMAHLKEKVREVIRSNRDNQG